MPPQHCCILLLGNVSNILKHKQLSESFLSQIPRQLLEARDFPKPQEHDLSLPKLPPAIQCSKVEDQTIDDIKTDDRVCTSSQKPSGEHLPASIQTFNGLVRHPVNATPVHSNFARCLPAFRCHSNDSNAWWKIWKAVVGPTRHFFSFRSHWHCAFYTLGMLAFIAQAMPGVWCAMHILCTGITPLVCLNTKGLSEVFSEKPKLTILCPVYLQFFKCVMPLCFIASFSILGYRQRSWPNSNLGYWSDCRISLMSFSLPGQRQWKNSNCQSMKCRYAMCAKKNACPSWAFTRLSSESLGKTSSEAWCIPTTCEAKGRDQVRWNTHTLDQIQEHLHRQCVFTTIKWTRWTRWTRFKRTHLSNSYTGLIPIILEI